MDATVETIKCTVCNGKKHDEGKDGANICYNCNGTGEVKVVVCGECNGTGKIQWIVAENQHCLVCNGRGKINLDRATYY